MSFVPEKNTKIIGGLYRVGLFAQKLHWPDCTANRAIDPPTDFAVEITTKSLNVEKPITLQ